MKTLIGVFVTGSDANLCKYTNWQYSLFGVRLWKSQEYKQHTVCYGESDFSSVTYYKTLEEAKSEAIKIKERLLHKSTPIATEAV